MSNVLPFRTRPRIENRDIQTHQEDAQVLDVTERIQAGQADERRQVKRVVLNEFISAHVFIQGRGLLRIVLKDIHDKGLAFEIDSREGQFSKAELLEVRFYMNHETYFKFNVQVMHAQTNEDDATERHGCQFVKDTINDVALHHFIGFLQNIAASLRTDKGDRTVSNIYS
ncbi:MAG: PilZ domain-containing protein [Bdellovibrio sp.]